MLMETSASKPVTAPRILLGVFILGQLVFLFATNFLGFAQEYKDHIPEGWQAPIERIAPGFTRQEGHAWELTQTLSRLTEMWDHITLQPQQWMLFAPNIGRDCTFPALELRWDEPSEPAVAIGRGLHLLAAGTPLAAVGLLGLTGNQDMPQAPELWLSDNEPEDIDRFFRIGNFRLRRFESTLALDLVPDDDPQETAEHWRGKIEDYLKSQTEGMLVLPYMKWRLEQIQGKSPARQQPRQVILLMRRYRINEPGETPHWQGPHTVPVARWQPGIGDNADFLPLEMYNPVTKRFESVPK
jgi:hypothetical protein